MSDEAKKVRLIPMDGFAIAKFEEERLRQVADWLEAREAGYSSEEAWAIAEVKADARRTLH